MEFVRAELWVIVWTGGWEPATGSLHTESRSSHSEASNYSAWWNCHLHQTITSRNQPRLEQRL